MNDNIIIYTLNYSLWKGCQDTGIGGVFTHLLVWI